MRGECHLACTSNFFSIIQADIDHYSQKTCGENRILGTYDGSAVTITAYYSSTILVHGGNTHANTN